MKEFTIEHTPAEIVKVFPKASDLFKARQIDYCCGGDKPLGKVFLENESLEREDILEVLNRSYQEWCEEDHKFINWDSVPLSQLVDHIMQTHHNYLYDELPALAEFVIKIYRVHGSNDSHLKELHRLFNEFKREMEEHSIKEDQKVFPLIKEYDQNPNEALLQKIRVANNELEEEHDAVGELLKEMRHITNGFTPPPHACGSYRITYARLAELEENTFQHVHLENNILFKQL